MATVTVQNAKIVIKSCFLAGQNVGFYSRPGMGKSHACDQAAQELNREIDGGIDYYTLHPAVEDPTVYSGLGFPDRDKGIAQMLPYGNLVKLARATRPTLVHIEDLGTAPLANQGALLQLVWAREINGLKIPANVVFIASTNRTSDRSGVMGITEALRDRFVSWLEIGFSLDEYVKYLITREARDLDIAFARYNAEMFDTCLASMNVEDAGNVSPRKFENFTRAIQSIPDPLIPAFSAGAIGPDHGSKYTAFTRVWKELPDLDDITARPETADLPPEHLPGVFFAIAGALTKIARQTNFDGIMQYVKRLPAMYQVLFVKDATAKRPELKDTLSFGQWHSDNPEIIFN